MAPLPLYGIMMVKNEETNIERSLQSFKGFDGVFLYDTGSTDKTIDVAVTTCKKLGLKLNVLRGTFVNFAVSRNALFDHIATFNEPPKSSTCDSSSLTTGGGNGVKDRLKKRLEEKKRIEQAKNTQPKLAGETDDIPYGVKWLVLLDANDEFIGMKSLRNFLADVHDEWGVDPVTHQKTLKQCSDVVYLRQRWKTAPNQYTNFKNQRCVRSDSTERYYYVVHEVLLDSDVVCRNCQSPDVWTGRDAKKPLEDTYYVVCQRCRHQHVHGSTNPQKPRQNIYAPDDVIVYQDRMLDTTMSSERRWARDRMMLQEQYDKWPIGKKDTRYIFYLAQTYKCLTDNVQSLKYYTERYNLPTGFQEEIYVSAWEMARILYSQFAEGIRPPPKYNKLLTLPSSSTPSTDSPKDDDVKNLSKKEQKRLNRLNKKSECAANPPTPANEEEKVVEDRTPVPLDDYSKSLIYRDYIFNIFEAVRLDTRVEPLDHIAAHLFANKCFNIAYMFSHFASLLSVPVVLLWYDENEYVYQRYETHGKICLALSNFDEGIEAVGKCINARGVTENIQRLSYEFTQRGRELKTGENGSISVRVFPIKRSFFITDVFASEQYQKEYVERMKLVTTLLEDFYTPAPVASGNMTQGERIKFSNEYQKWIEMRKEKYKIIVINLFQCITATLSLDPVIKLARVFRDYGALDLAYMVCEYGYCLIKDAEHTPEQYSDDQVRDVMRIFRRVIPFVRKSEYNGEQKSVIDVKHCNKRLQWTVDADCRD
jgi:glycosyltransferase involved in cell wall biosynthesis